MNNEPQEGPETPITVEKWLKSLSIRDETVSKTSTKGRKGLTVVKKKQGVPAIIVDQDQKHDAVGAQNGVLCYYKKVELTDILIPSIHRLVIVPAELWRKMTTTNLFIGKTNKE